MRLIVLWFGGLIAFGLPQHLECADSLLRFNWQAGKRYTVSITTSAQLVLERFPTNANTGGETETSEFTIAVVKPESNEGCELIVECLSTRSEMKGESAYSFNSTTDPKQDVGIPYAAQKRAFIGTKLRFLLDRDQKVLRVEGTDELLRKMLAHDPALKGDLSTPFVTEAKFGTNALTGLLRELMVVGIPKKSLKVGDRWTLATEQKERLTITDSQFTFEGLEKHLGRGCAKVGFSGSIKDSSNRGSIPSEVPTPKVQGELKGKLWLDTNLQMLVERTAVEETKSQVDMPSVHAQEGATVPMTINEKRTVAVRLVKVEDK